MPTDQEKENSRREEVRTGRESVLRRVGEFSARESELGAALAGAEKSGDDGEAGRLKGELEILSLERETFAYERDNTGAYVGERWGRDLAKRYGEDGERPIEMAKDGTVKERAEDKTSFTMVVAMGELDRMNKEAGQKAGDWALEHVTSVIETTCAAQKVGADGNAPSFEIYRSDGNAFSVEFRNMSEEAIAEVKKALESYREVPPRLKEAGITEAPPLAVSELPHATMVAALDSYFKADKRAEAEAPTLPDPAEVQRTMVDIVKTASTYNSEIQKYVSRCDRMIESVAAEGTDTEHTQEFFKKYIEKGLGGSAFNTPKVFREKVAPLLGADFTRLSGEAKAARVKGIKEALRADFDEEGKNYAAKFLANDRAVKSERDRAIVESVLKGMGDGSRVDEVKRIANQAAEAPKRQESVGAKEPFPLPGRAVLEQKKAEAERAEKEFGPESRQARKAKAEFELEKVKRDPSTGLEKKRSFFFDLQDKLKEGKECSAVFIDMAFLKYFDREGGTEVGNDAIKRAAGVLEKAVEEVRGEDKGVDAKVYRFGGDEFSISVSGGNAAAEKIKAAIERLSGEAGTVPGGVQSKDTYRDQGLTFNIGIADKEDMLAVEGLLKERDPSMKEETESQRMKRRAELMTDMADAGLGPEKSLNRFMYLMAELQDARYPESQILDPNAEGTGGETSEYVRAVNKLIEYSEKAIFAQGMNLREWAAKIRRGEADMNEFVVNVRKEINERVEAALVEKKTNKLVLDLVVQAKVNEKRLREEIKRAETERDTAAAKYGKEHEEVVKRDRRIEDLNKKVEKLAKDFIDKQ